MEGKHFPEETRKVDQLQDTHDVLRLAAVQVVDEEDQTTWGQGLSGVVEVRGEAMLLTELDLHINDAAFAEATAGELVAMLRESTKSEAFSVPAGRAVRRTSP